MKEILNSIEKNRNILLSTIILLVVFFTVFLSFVFSQKGLLGEDFMYFAPRLIKGADFFLKNFSMMYFTQECGGLPSYANPQDMYLSLPQFLFILFNPSFAIALSLVIYMLLGFYGTYALLRYRLNYSLSTAVIGGFLFLCNGFNITHFTAGHYPYISFALIPLIIYLLYTPSDGNRFIKYRDILFNSILCASIIYSGGLHPANILGIQVLIFHFFFKKMDIKIPIITAIISLVIGTSRFVAIYDFTKFMHPKPFINPANGFFDSLFASFSMLVMPSEMGHYGNLSKIAGWWELNSNLSLFVVLLVTFGLFNKVKLVKHPIGFAIFTIFLLLFGGAFEPLVKLNAKIPLYKSYWVTPRYLFLFILPFIVLSSNVLESDALLIKIKNFIKNENTKIWFFSFGSIAYVFLTFNINLGDLSHLRRTGFEYKIPTKEIYSYPLPKFNKIGSLRESRQDPLGTIAGRCYEPIFGYALESMKARLFAASPKQKIMGGFFNMTNPACLIAPKENKCLPWSRFTVEKEEELDLFLENKSFDWVMPTKLKIANAISLITFILVLTGILIATIKSFNGVKEEENIQEN